MKDRNTPNMMVRQGIEEIMPYGKEFNVVEIKEMLFKEKGLVYEKDYTEGNLSSALYILSNTGVLIKQKRGVYQKAYNKNKVDKEENCNISYEVKEVLELFQKNKNKIQEIFGEICAALKKVDLSNGAADDELEELKKVLAFKDAVTQILETFE